MTKESGDSIETLIRKMVDEAVEDREIKLKKEDAQEIIDAILPQLETMVSKVVIKHLKALGTYMQKNLKD